MQVSIIGPQYVVRCMQPGASSTSTTRARQAPSNWWGSQSWDGSITQPTGSITAPPPGFYVSGRGTREGDGEAVACTCLPRCVAYAATFPASPACLVCRRRRRRDERPAARGARRRHASRKDPDEPALRTLPQPGNQRGHWSDGSSSAEGRGCAAAGRQLNAAAAEACAAAAGWRRLHNASPLRNCIQ